MCRRWATCTAVLCCMQLHVAWSCRWTLKQQCQQTTSKLCSGFCASLLAYAVSPSFLGCHPVPSHPLPRGLTRTRPSAWGCRARLTPIHSSSRSPLQVFPHGSPLFFPGGRRKARVGLKNDVATAFPRMVLGAQDFCKLKKKYQPCRNLWQNVAVLFSPLLFHSKITMKKKVFHGCLRSHGNKHFTEQITRGQGHSSKKENLDTSLGFFIVAVYVYNFVCVCVHMLGMCMCVCTCVYIGGLYSCVCVYIFVCMCAYMLGACIHVFCVCMHMLEVCIHVWGFICLYMCIYVGVYIQVCAESRGWCQESSQSLSTLCFEAETPTELGAHRISYIGWPMIPRLSRLHVLNTGIAGSCDHIQLFTWILRDELRPHSFTTKTYQLSHLHGPLYKTQWGKSLCESVLGNARPGSGVSHLPLFYWARFSVLNSPISVFSRQCLGKPFQICTAGPEPSHLVYQWYCHCFAWRLHFLDLPSQLPVTFHTQKRPQGGLF